MTTIYRYLTGPDDATFCHKVTRALSEGWLLHGPTSYAFDGIHGVMRCGQAVIKETEQPYDPERKLTDY